MRLPARLRLMTGLLTICLFLVLGGSLWASERTLYGGLVLGLAALRAAVWVRELWWTMQPEDDEDDEA